jgi:hypothetical protein
LFVPTQLSRYLFQCADCPNHYPCCPTPPSIMYSFYLHIQSNMRTRSLLLSSPVTFFLSCHRKFHMNWSSFNMSPVLKSIVCPKCDLLTQVWLYIVKLILVLNISWDTYIWTISNNLHFCQYRSTRKSTYLKDVYVLSHTRQ